MKTIDDILNIVVEDEGAMIVRPATKKDISLCQDDMSNMKFPSLPPGYADFLKLLNGFAWNGIEFYSTDQVTDTDTGYMLLDIVSANEQFRVYFEQLPHCIILGRSDMDWYVYNTQSGRYEVIDESDGVVMEHFEDFLSMFIAVVSPRI